MYKIGDKVKIIKCLGNNNEFNGEEGVVSSINEGHAHPGICRNRKCTGIRVEIKRIQGITCCFDEVEPIESTLMNIKSLAKKLLDADTRAFIRAGILDSNLEFTEDGEKFVLGHYFLENKKTLAEEARKLVKENKKKNKCEDSDDEE